VTIVIYTWGLGHNNEKEHNRSIESVMLGFSVNHSFLWSTCLYTLEDFEVLE